MPRPTPIPHIILFEDEGFRGRHKHVFRWEEYIGDEFNDVTSSFVILSGHWQFFEDINCVGQMGYGGGKTLGPGIYDWIENPRVLGQGTNDKLSSLKPV